ncbi:unnamed protein product [Heterobilharzia americana]|nr:unnamed protein product [Heterobilharzia americana]CAH8590071.1 unnamed protein product [Heterobilharzia americana]
MVNPLAGKNYSWIVKEVERNYSISFHTYAYTNNYPDFVHFFYVLLNFLQSNVNQSFLLLLIIQAVNWNVAV